MYLVLLFLIFFIWCSVFNPACSSAANQLNGRHLRVIWPRWSGNRKGLSGPLKGGVVLDFLSARLNFTYEMVRVAEELEPEIGRGQIDYLIDNQCDLLIQSVFATSRRNKIVDLTLPWVYDSSAFLIPVPDETANVNAVVKPFQWQIWLVLGLSIICVIAVLNFIHKYRPSQKEADTIELAETKTGQYYLYTFGTLLSQGGPCTSKRLSIRLVAAAWCLAAFIFVQAYNSTLFTYVVTPVHQPLINSIYDIFENSDINLLVRTDTIDLLLKRNNNTGVFLKIQKKLDSYANSRCALASNCIQSVASGSRNVYFESRNYLKDAIRTEFKRTGKCKLQLAKEGFTGVTSSLALQKNSPYTQSTTQGILELQQTGIIDYWDTWFRPMPPQCNGKPPTGVNSPGNNPSRLSLKNLTGAFLVLLVGLGLSFMAFLFEQIVAILSERHRVKTLTELVQVAPGESTGEFTGETQEELSITEEELSGNSNIEEPPSNVTEVTGVEVIVESMDIITIATQENE
ncbi:glutamate receptor ionotropic, delta-1-like isoform X1 [Daphnia pulex]|uniref:glutamate receptor ionotropic, delta-1-like isoform X1 n=1 Tax=Daphnia pulex TaxID=6669 RepID=UPI001EDD3132|nr:glutamate receptor ionotropic, delta-1-like isoform X1 [Daphnia pulex]